MADGDTLLRDLETVLAISRAMGSERELDRLLDLIIRSGSDLIGAERSSLFLVDHDRQELVTSIAQGAAAIRLPLGRGIAGAVAGNGATINIPHAYSDPRFDPENDRRSGFRTQSILCMPLVAYDGTVVGVIQALNKRGGAFTGYDERVLGALCSQAAVAIATAQLIARDRERQRLAAELAIASRIQGSLLPGEPPQVAGWRFAHWARSCDETGGDYFDYMPVRDGGMDLVVGDVSGHGIGAALLMSTARAFLRALHVGGAAPGEVVGGLNRLLEKDMADDTFMSLVLCRLAPDGSASYVSAGHEPPLVHRAGGGGDALESTGLLLGLLGEEVYEPYTLPALAPGDLLVLYTDGMWECQSPDGEQFGVERMRALVARHAAAGAAAVRDALVAGSLAHLAGRPPLDDMTVIVAERVAS